MRYPDNPNFTFLDELAERKIENLSQQYKKSGLHTGRLELQKAKETLRRGIGTKYCQQYGLISAMEQPKLARAH